MKIITNNSHSYFIDDLDTVELGSVIFDTDTNKMYSLLEPKILTELGINNAQILKDLSKIVATGGEITISATIDAPTGFVVAANTTITNNGEIAISEDTVGDGVFKVTNGTLILDGKGTINGLDKSGWSMAIWATENGKVVIKDGYFTNVGAHSETDSEHYDLIYASGNGQIEILGGEFKCETPKWILNIKNADRETASIVVKGGKFHGFNPMEAEEGNLVAPGYKVVETDGIFEVIPE